MAARYRAGRCLGGARPEGSGAGLFPLAAASSEGSLPSEASRGWRWRRFAALGRGAGLLVGARLVPSLTGVPAVLVASPLVPWSSGVRLTDSLLVCPAVRLESRPLTQFNEQRGEIMSYSSAFEGEQSKAPVPFLASPLLQQKHFSSACWCFVFFFPLVHSGLFTEKAGKLNYFGIPDI